MLRVIKTEQEYELALEKAYLLMQEEIELNTKQADELDLLTLLIEHYEQSYYPILPPSPIEAIKFRLEQLDKSPSELSKILGARSRQSEILSGKRKLSLSMIRKLHEVLNIPAESLIGAY
jgi:HTH-type transcriptional regulator/antitoxin HigA